MNPVTLLCRRSATGDVQNAFKKSKSSEDVMMDMQSNGGLVNARSFLGYSRYFNVKVYWFKWYSSCSAVNMILKAVWPEQVSACTGLAQYHIMKIMNLEMIMRDQNCMCEEM
jgi:hypothetical protein